MKNTIIYLIGFPGTGKLTIAKEICKQADFHLVDNHLINNPVFTLIERDGITPFPDAVWVQTAKIRAAVLETMQTISPPDYNFVMTNVLVDDDTGDLEIYNNVKSMADERGAHFVPVVLTCETEENMRRIASPERKENMKELSPEGARKIRAENTLLKPNHTNEIMLDVTDLSADKSAAHILKHLQ